MKKENAAIIEMLCCAALWSIAGIFIKLIDWNAFVVAGFRSLLAGLTLLTYMRIKRIRLILNGKTLISGLLTACVYICFVGANKLTTAANAIVIQFTSPVFIVIFSAIFLKKKIRRADIAAVACTLIGITLFFLDQLKPGYIIGNLVAMCAGMFMAGMFMVVGQQSSEGRFSTITIGQAITFIVGIPFMIITKPVFTQTAVLSILALGIFQLGISYVLYLKSSEYCPPLACCLLGVVEPLLNPVWVFLFDGEHPGIFALIGSVIVVVSITLWCIFGQEKKSAVPKEV